MSIFLLLLLKLLPIYGVMVAGYFLARKANNVTGSLAVLQIYFIAPIVIFSNVSSLQLSFRVALLPLLSFFLSAFISTSVYFLTRSRLDNSGPLLAQASGTMNNGYLGVPVALAIFPDTLLPTYLFTMVATSIYEGSLGYYFIARGKFTVRDALRKLATLPTLYAVGLGLALATQHFVMPEMLQGIIRDFRGAYVILGSLIVGMGLAQVRKLEFDFKFLGTLFGIKFIAWPALAALLLFIERITLGVIQPDQARIILLMSCLPLAANTAAFAALVGVHPEKAATAVAASTLLALVTLPLSAILFGLI